MSILFNVIVPLLILTIPFVLVYLWIKKTQPGNIYYQLATVLALVTAFLLVWMNLAVGLIGSEDDPANLLFAVVLFTGLILGFLFNFRPQPMSNVMLLLVGLHLAIGFIAWFFELGKYGNNWPNVIFIFTGFYMVLWAVCSLLYRVSANERRSKNTQMDNET